MNSEVRIAVIETKVQHMEKDLTEVRSDVKEILEAVNKLTINQAKNNSGWQLMGKVAGLATVISASVAAAAKYWIA